MGISSSCYSGGGTSTATAVKLILLDGQLREFTSPVKVFLVATPPSTDLCSFICNADEMDFDKHVTAMSDHDELRPGQLYFQLPASWLNRRLEAEDMASLAVKAGTALMIGSSGGKVRCGCCVKRVDPLVFCFDEKMMSSSYSTEDGGGADNSGVKSHGGGGGLRGGGKGRLFTSLERIAEE